MSTDKKKTIPLTSKIALVGVILLLVLFSAQWISLSNNLQDYKEEKDIELSNIKKIREDALINIENTKINDTTVVVKIEDIQVINERYDELFEYVKNNTNRAESLIDKDLDRLSLYLAIGIGFIGVLGVFVPILINLMSVHDLRDKLNNTPNKNELNDISIQANNAMEKVKKLEGLDGKIEDLTDWYKESAPAITSLILQNAIGRFFNISPFLITRLTRNKEKVYFIELLKTIKDGFKKCDDDQNHSIESSQFLKDTIKDFRIFITNKSFHSSMFNENVVEKIEELSQLLKNLIESSSDTESEINKAVREKLNEIIKEFS